MVVRIYVQSKTKTRESVGNLVDNSGVTVREGAKKATALNQFFTSVFNLPKKKKKKKKRKKESARAKRSWCYNRRQIKICTTYSSYG